MVEVRWTHQAYQDLNAIVEFIAKDSAQYARLFVIDIFQAVDRIAEFPKSGRMVPELGNPAVREIILRKLPHRLPAEGKVRGIAHGLSWRAAIGPRQTQIGFGRALQPTALHGVGIRGPRRLSAPLALEGGDRMICTVRSITRPGNARHTCLRARRSSVDTWCGYVAPET